MVSLASTLKRFPREGALAGFGGLLRNWKKHRGYQEIYGLIGMALVEDPPLPYGRKHDQDRVPRRGGQAALHYLRRQGLYRELESAEREKTGIKNLKISYNRVFGYYTEVTKSYYDLVPPGYIESRP